MQAVINFILAVTISVEVNGKLTQTLLYSHTATDSTTSTVLIHKCTAATRKKNTYTTYLFNNQHDTIQHSRVTQ